MNAIRRLIFPLAVALAVAGIAAPFVIGVTAAHADPIVLVVGFHRALDLMIHHGEACWHLPYAPHWACTAVHP